MTRPGVDDTGWGTEGRAHKRIKDLLKDAFGVVEIEPGWLIKQPMDDFYQLWHRVDKEWAVQVERRLVDKQYQALAKNS